MGLLQRSRGSFRLNIRDVGGCGLATTDLVNARAILEKAINAEGGEKLLSKLNAVHSRSKGKIHLDAVRDFTSEEDVQLPDKFKSVIQLEVNGKNFTITQVFDGKKGWFQVMGKTIDLDDQAVNEIKEILQRMGLGLGMKFDERGRIIWPPLPSQTAPPTPEETAGL